MDTDPLYLALEEEELYECTHISQQLSGMLMKYQQELHETKNLKSINRGFKRINHAIAAYDQTKLMTELFLP